MLHLLNINVTFEFQKEVIDLVNIRRRAPPVRCDYNLLSLKRERSTREYYDEIQERYSAARHRSLYVSSCYKALYAQDWDRLLYILKKVPKWKFEGFDEFHMRVRQLVRLVPFVVPMCMLKLQRSLPSAVFPLFTIAVNLRNFIMNGVN